MKRYGLLCASILIATHSLTTYAAGGTAIKDYAKNVTASAQSNYAQTKYPIVFTHGLFGFRSIIGIDYYYGILPDLARNGGNVWSTQISSMNSNEVRGEQLLQQVDEVLAVTGKDKVNLVGHSHGGQTVRYVAGVAPQKVVSVTTIGSGNQGAKIADLLYGVLAGTVLEKPARVIFDSFVTPVIDFASGADQNVFPADAKAALISLTADQSLVYNQKFPNGVPTTKCGEGAYQVNGTYYFSFMGNSPFNSMLDPSDYGILAASPLAGSDTDGLIGRCDSRFGKVVRDNHKWNHFDEINQLLGIKGMFAADPVQVYREHANRLKLLGL